MLQQTVTRCNTLHHAATCCNTLQRQVEFIIIKSVCNKLQHDATNCNTLQHAATRCNKLQHAAETRWIHHCQGVWFSARVSEQASKRERERE